MEKLKQDLSLNHLPGDTLFISAPHSCADSECPGDINRRKLQAAEEMAKAAKLTFDSFGNKSLRIKGYEALQAALTSWEKAGKEVDI